MKRDTFKTGHKVTLNSKLRNGIRVRLKGVVEKNYITKQEAIVKTALGNKIHFSYKGNQIVFVNN